MDRTKSKAEAGLERYREENPGEFAGWYVPKTGGYVVAIGNVKVYRGPCKHCETGVVTTVRKLSIEQQSGSWYGSARGRWPETCAACQGRKAEKHDDDARRRMRRTRNKYGYSPADRRVVDQYPDRRKREHRDLPPHL
jgi:hypothetical protein